MCYACQFIYMAIYRRGGGGNSTMIVVLAMVYFWGMVESVKEIIVETPFYLRARVHDAHTASVQFEIAEEKDQRVCQKYQFTIRRNRESPYSMPEQNLTFWRNSLELKHLAVGNYCICAIICSEYLNQSAQLPCESIHERNRSLPISTCVTIHAYRSHFLVLTLYILAFIILAFSQIVFSLRKRKIRARIKTAMFDVENALQKWRSVQPTTASTDGSPSFSILQSLVNLPTIPMDHSAASSSHSLVEEHRSIHPITFHLDLPHEQNSNVNDYSSL